MLGALTATLNACSALTQFKQLSGNRRMVIPFGQRGSTVYAVDVAALDPQAVHEAASKVRRGWI